MSKPVENFYKSLLEPQRQHMPRGKISNALENNSVAASFRYLKLREEVNGRLEKARQRLDYRRVNKINEIMCPLEGYPLSGV